MEKDVSVELWDLRCRGALAAAFQHADMTPSAIQWEMLRGQREITMRDIGEISFATCLELSLSLIEKRQPTPANE